MNTEDSEFARIEREQAMRGVPDAIHHTDKSESLEYITGWNDCRQAILAEQPAPVQEPVYYGNITGAKEVRTLYTPQAQRKPLTDEFLEALAEKHVTNCYFDTLAYARAIEDAHGIKQENT